MKAINNKNLLFITITSMLLMVPVVFISYHYNHVFVLLKSMAGTMGLAVLMLLVFLSVSYLNKTAAKFATMALFIVVLMSRIIKAFVYDFSGRGFTSEFFAHFSWDSFVIGLDDYGFLLLIAILLLLIFAFYLSKLLTTDNSSNGALISTLLVLVIILVYPASRQLPEWRLMIAYDSYHNTPVETKDINAIQQNFLHALDNIRTNSDLPKHKNQVAANLPEKPKNLILIYLESFSDVLTENPKYPNLTPHLDELKNRYFSFENYHTGGYVTIEGIANSQCGTLMNMESGSNSLTSSTGRLSSLPCLGDVLKTAGYKQVFMGGADLEFAGKGAFFKEHGYDELWGKYKWENSGFPSTNTWGLSDADLFDQAFKQIQTLSKKPQPFNLTLLTLGTHIPGFVYEGCTPYDKSVIDNSFIDGIHCTDYLVGQFINKLQEHGLLDDTVVQIQGDHGIFPTHEMKSLFGPNAVSHNIFNLTIDPDNKTDALNKSRPTSALNLVANLLDLLDVSHNANFILSYSDFQNQSDNRYLISRYTDFFANKNHNNGYRNSVECDQDLGVIKELPLTTCNKRSVLNAIYQLGSTYSGQLNNHNVCHVGAEIHLNAQSLKPLVRWGGIDLSGQFFAKGRTFSDLRLGFYLIELNLSDQVSNQLFFDYLDPMDMLYLNNILSGKNNRYFLFSNLSTHVISQLEIQHLPDFFAEYKMLYAQNQNFSIESLFEQEYMTGSLSFVPKSCSGSVEIIKYDPNPELGTINFCEVTSWGPKQSKQGNPFNEQPNGNSALWFKTDCFPQGAKVSFNGVMIPTTSRPGVVTAALDPSLLMPKPGSYPIEFIHPESGLKHEVGRFQLLPNNEWAPDNQPYQLKEIKPLQPPALIAHAGGAINNLAMLNTLEALEQNYDLGHRFFEIDFSWTADDQLVAIHDWEISYRTNFKGTHKGIPSHREFMAMKMNNQQTQLDLIRLDEWLSHHKDAYVVTDIKGKNLDGLKLMRQKMKTASMQVIPQMYHHENHQLIQLMGYQHIIFTLYATNRPYFELVKFISNNDLFAITIHPDKRHFKILIKAANQANQFTYVHTYNTPEEYDFYQQMGVNGLYTDRLFINPEGQIVQQ